MKKKFRSLTIDGENWAWNFRAKGDYYDCKSMKIWKDKKVVFKKTFKSEYGNEEKNYKITPGLITRFIKIYLKK